MSRSLTLKVIALFLAAISLVTVAGSSIAFFWMNGHNLYTQSPDARVEEYMEQLGMEISELVVRQYNTFLFGKGPVDLLESPRLYAGYADSYWQLQEQHAFYTIYGEAGAVLESTMETLAAPCPYTFRYTLGSSYPVIVETGSQEDHFYRNLMESQWHDQEYSEEASMEDKTSLESGTILHCAHWESEYGDHPGYQVYFFEGPTYAVEVGLLEDAWGYHGTHYWWAVNLLYRWRYAFLAGMVLGVLFFLGAACYLCWVSGRTKGTEEIRLVGVNCLPLDLHLLVSGGASMLLCYVVLLMMEWAMDGTDINFGAVVLGGFAAVSVAMLVVMFLYSFSAQIKAGNHHWWRNSLLGRLLRFLWNTVKFLFRGCVTLFSLLPLVWQWLVLTGGLLLALLVSFFIGRYNGYFLFFLCLLAVCAAVLYVSYALGVLLRGLKQMAKGDLAKKVPTRFLLGSFLDAANHLNALADVTVQAAKNQLRSERMRTELITNVSHDIKTPLTSIINFVDLLQKPHTSEQEQQYLEVLDRQSHSMKKLIEDLMELSKASTGNINVSLTSMDAWEVVLQALGEFSGKLDAAGLIPVFQRPQESVTILADGRLVWRVLSNVLSNAVKYALPGTRVYVDVTKAEDQVLISLKNISREQLNVSAEELMERFVRGDTSRNTEGSGLGLNIAKSLMELQHGQLQLLVDGDLFKVTLIFPGI